MHHFLLTCVTVPESEGMSVLMFFHSSVEMTSPAICELPPSPLFAKRTLSPVSTGTLLACGHKGQFASPVVLWFTPGRSQ